MRILITGARAPACLEWARLVLHAGCAVAVADSAALPLTRFSNCAERYFRLPAPVDGVQEYGEALAAAAKTFQADWILPTCEEAFYIAHQKRRIERVCRVLAADFELMASLHNKLTFADFTRGLPITAPVSFLIDSMQRLMENAGQCHELVLKPCYSRFAARTLVMPSVDDLRRIRPTQGQPWIAQEYVPGRELCSYSILMNGQLRAHACYHPKYRVGQGAGIYLEPVTSVAIQEFVEAFGCATAYTGQVGFDFIESADGRLSVLECNPRATSGIHLFCGQGKELAAILERPHESAPKNCPIVASGPPRMVKIAMALFAAPRIRGGAARHEYQRDWQRARDIISSDDDRRPTLAQWLSLGEVYFRALKLGCSPLAATTADIEWNGQPLGPQS